MSRGLGRVQRDILATLDTAKQAAPFYKGGTGRGAWWVRDWQPGIVGHWGREARLPDGVYDLRCSLRYLLIRDGLLPDQQHPPSWTTNPDPENPDSRAYERYRVAFSRAVRSLVARGLLIEATPFPGWSDADYQDWLERVIALRRPHAYEWSRRQYRRRSVPRRREVRFVRVPDSTSV